MNTSPQIQSPRPSILAPSSYPNTAARSHSQSTENLLASQSGDSCKRPAKRQRMDNAGSVTKKGFDNSEHKYPLAPPPLNFHTDPSLLPNASSVISEHPIEFYSFLISESIPGTYYDDASYLERIPLVERSGQNIDYELTSVYHNRPDTSVPQLSHDPELLPDGELPL